MTQRTKLELLEKKFDRTKPWKKPNYGIFKAGKAALTYIWRVFQTIAAMSIDGSQADVKWIEDAEPGQQELLEVAEVVNLVNGIDVQWEEIE